MFLFDLGFGLLIVVSISLTAQLEPSLSLVLTGIAGSLLPDWDMLPHLIKKRGKLDQWAHKHRDISHYPLLTVPLCGVAVGWMIGVWYGVVLAVTMTAHYLTDSFEVGWGVRWLFPFCNRYFCYRTAGQEKRRFRTWTPTQQDELAIRFGNPDWHKESKRWRFDLIVFAIGVAATIVLFLTS